MTHVDDYQTYRNLPPLAGLCSMKRAVESQWSLEESVTRLKRIHHVFRRVHESLIARIPGEPIYELKTLYSHHAYLCAEQIDLIRKRVSEMREPPLGLDKVPDLNLETALDELSRCPDTVHFLAGLYRTILPQCVIACERLQNAAHPLADAPTVRISKLMAFEIRDVCSTGKVCLDCLLSDEDHSSVLEWQTHLQAYLSSAGSIDGTSDPTPAPLSRRYETEDVVYQREPKRDERFRDPYNAGVNPEAFLYNEQYTAKDKTLMIYYKRLREIDVPEVMATILIDLRDEEPWDFHMEMSRQMWDEARHAMMGEVGFASQDIDWTEIPINFTWSKNLNTQLSPRERHGVLFFIEQGLMPKTGKRYEWEVASASGDALAKLFQDFDWADEVLHAQIGRRWYVPRYNSLSEAMDYGDKCWTRVLSKWQEYQDQGLTEHRNWWPELYTKVCSQRGTLPDPETLAFNQTYQEQRADLESLD
jgi:hypothetical protein